MPRVLVQGESVQTTDLVSRMDILHVRLERARERVYETGEGHAVRIADSLGRSHGTWLRRHDRVSPTPNHPPRPASKPRQTC